MILILGVVLSMFTALYVTRTVFEWGLQRGMVAELRMRQMFARPSLNFLKHRRTAALISAVCIVIGVTTFRAVCTVNMQGLLPSMYEELGLGLWKGGIANSILLVSF